MNYVGNFGRAQPVARALGKRWERRLPVGSWAQPTHGRFASYCLGQK